MNLDIQGAMKRFSGAIIKPVMFLAVAGILLAVSVILKMEGMPAPVVMLGQLIYTCVNSGVVGNLGLIFWHRPHLRSRQETRRRRGGHRRLDLLGLPVC